MLKKDLTKKVAQLEFINDQLVTELEYIDTLARQLGFENGLRTLKKAAKDLIEEQNIDGSEDAM
ncbi:MAG: hypothetical protein JXA94_01925 [Parachlamydiales bacterium]|nr:hypothetical protein [Parachlamydiales bacterium]